MMKVGGVFCVKFFPKFLMENVINPKINSLGKKIMFNKHHKLVSTKNRRHHTCETKKKQKKRKFHHDM